MKAVIQSKHRSTKPYQKPELKKEKQLTEITAQAPISQQQGLGCTKQIMSWS